MLRPFLLGTAGLAILALATPSFAADMEPEKLSAFSGQIDAWLGYWFMDDDQGNPDPEEKEDFTFGVDAKARFNMFDAWSIQADLSADGVDGDGNDFYHGGLLGGGHLSWSDQETFLLGGFAAGGSGDTQNDEHFWLAGAEAQIYFDTFTLYGQAGYFDAREGGGDVNAVPRDAFHNAWFGRIVGRYFFSPNDRLQGEFSYADGEQDTDDQNMDVFSWGARFDHQIVDNMAVFAAYNGGFFENHGGNGDNGSFYDHVIRGGISISLGRPDLLSVDRTGPNLDMPWAGRWAASGNIVD